MLSYARPSPQRRNLFPAVGQAAVYIPENEKEIIDKLGALVIIWPIQPSHWYAKDKNGKILYEAGTVFRGVRGGDDYIPSYFVNGPTQKIQAGEYREDLEMLHHNWRSWPKKADLLDELEKLIGTRPTHDLAEYTMGIHLIAKYLRNYPKDSIDIVLPDKRTMHGYANEKGEPIIHHDSDTLDKSYYRGKKLGPLPKLTQGGQDKAEKNREKEFSKIEELFSTEYHAKVTRGLGNKPYFTGKPVFKRHK